MKCTERKCLGNVVKGRDGANIGLFQNLAVQGTIFPFFKFCSIDLEASWNFTVILQLLSGKKANFSHTAGIISLKFQFLPGIYTFHFV